MSESTPGAMRAAREHYTLTASRIDPNDADGFEWLESEIINLAQIIDRETGAVGMLEALKEIADRTSKYRPTVNNLQIRSIARAAIAEVEKK